MSESAHDVKVGDTVKYVMPSGEEGWGVVGDTRKGRIVKALIVYVAVEERHQVQAPFVIRDGEAVVAWGSGNSMPIGTHRAFSQFQVFKENI